MLSERCKHDEEPIPKKKGTERNEGKVSRVLSTHKVTTALVGAGMQQMIHALQSFLIWRMIEFRVFKTTLYGSEKRRVPSLMQY
jgi:hypothetical protein